eukprot:g846.t1
MRATTVSHVHPYRPVVVARRASHRRLSALGVDPSPLPSTERTQLEEEMDTGFFYETFDELLDKTGLSFGPGDRVMGRVTNMDDSGIYIEFGSKETGFCSNTDLALQTVSKPSEIISVNAKQEFEILTTGVRSRYLDGYITVLTRSPIVRGILLKRLNTMQELKIKTRVQVVSKNRGGYIVRDEYGLEGFLPGRLAAVNPALSGLNDDPLLGQEITVRVLEAQEDNIIFSQRGIVQGGSNESKFARGMVLEGVVEGVMPYGVFVSSQGVAGLLHITQISHATISNIHKLFKERDRIKVMVLSYDQLRGRLLLSTKKLEQKPGDMLRDWNLVFENAEETAEKHRRNPESPGITLLNRDDTVITPEASFKRRSKST